MDLEKLSRIIGSGNQQLVREVVIKHRADLLEADSLGEFFEEYQGEITSEYDALANGDFSLVDLHRSFDGANFDEDELADDDPDARKVEQLRKAGDHEGLIAFFTAQVNDLAKDLFDDSAEEDGLAEDPVKEITAGEALAHLVLGGNMDPDLGFKYGYALLSLCEHIGQRLASDSWCGIGYRSFELIDQGLDELGIRAGELQAYETFVERGSPIAMPQPDDFPGIGYLRREEIAAILPTIELADLESIARRVGHGDKTWLGAALHDLHYWLQVTFKQNLDIITFYF